MQRLLTIDNITETHDAISALENGSVVLLPHQAFDLEDHETCFLTEAAINPNKKNMSYNAHTKQLTGDNYENEAHLALQHMMNRYVSHASNLINQLFPEYQTHLTLARTSFRVAEAKGRQAASFRKDDQRLHVDAFPSNPNQGNRILRVFSNINPSGKPRVWRIGEAFDDLARRFQSQLKRPLPATKHVLEKLNVTKSLRTDYDALMLQLHDKMKADMNYQQNAAQETLEFPANSTWIVYSDVASHAVVSGQYCLEQTFHLPVKAMKEPTKSPLKILESMWQRELV